MKKFHFAHYVVFMGLAIVGVNKAADLESPRTLAIEVVTDGQSSPCDQDSPRTKTKKMMQKAFSYHDHGEKPREGQSFPNLKVPQSVTLDSLVSIAEASAAGAGLGALPGHDSYEDYVDRILNRSQRIISTKKSGDKKSTLAALRGQFPSVRTGLADEAKSAMSSQEQQESDAPEGIQVES